MKIKAIEKLTLIDYPGKIACTLFFFGCNFRCGFCHNPELVIKEKNKDLEEGKILDFLKARIGKLEGVCITGGEPLIELKKDFLEKVKKIGYFVKLDTNGSFPEKLNEFLKEGLVDFVAMDIKSSEEKYKEIANVNVNLEEIEKSIKILSKFGNYEFRTTIIEGIHTLEDIKKMSLWLNKITGGKVKKICLQGFKNNGKFINKSFNDIKDTTEIFLEKLKNEIKDYFLEVEIRV